MQLMLADGVGMDLYSAAFCRVADRLLSSQKRTACKYADVSQRKRHSHASVDSKVGDNGRRREEHGTAARSFCP